MRPGGSRSGWRRVVKACLVAAAALVPLGAGAGNPDVAELVHETQKHGTLPGRLSIVWWIPEEFWTTSFRSGGMTPDQQQSFLNALRPYVIVGAVDGTLSALGGMDFVDPETLRGTIKIIDAKGRAYAPLADETLSADVKNLSAMLGSMFANMMGAMGKNLRLYYFPAADADGVPIAQAKQEGSFTVDIGSERFTYRLPLSSLIPPKACPVDGEKMSGAWKYCPWHGKKLEETKEPQEKPAEKPAGKAGDKPPDKPPGR